MASAFSIAPPGLSPLDVVNTDRTATSANGAATDQAKAHAAAQSFEAVFLNTMFPHMYTGIGGEGPFGGSGAERRLALDAHRRICQIFCQGRRRRHSRATSTSR